MVVLFGQPHLEEIVLVLDLREPDGCQPGEDQWQEYENDVMAVKVSIENDSSRFKTRRGDLLGKRFVRIFSERSMVVLQLPSCPSKQD